VAPVEDVARVSSTKTSHSPAIECSLIAASKFKFEDTMNYTKEKDVFTGGFAKRVMQQYSHSFSALITFARWCARSSRRHKRNSSPASFFFRHEHCQSTAGFERAFFFGRRRSSLECGDNFSGADTVHFSAMRQTTEIYFYFAFKDSPAEKPSRKKMEK
jgi:hypothetical protein